MLSVDLRSVEVTCLNMSDFSAQGSSSHLKRDVAHAQTHPDTRTNIPPEFSQLPAEEEQDVTESTLGDIPTVMFVMNPMSPVDENEAL